MLPPSPGRLNLVHVDAEMLARRKFGFCSKISRILAKQSCRKGTGDTTFTEPVEVLFRPQMVGVVEVTC
jgi:hypothetical protein